MNILTTIIQFALSFGLLIIAMTIHEFAHGLVAYKLGDPTARFAGRLTLNPLAHIDLFWTVILPFVLFISTSGQFVFGAAKPVPINYFALRNPKRDIIWIGLAGPAANFGLAFLISIFMKFAHLPDLAVYLLSNLLVINVVLGVFNLMPIPPLDGSRVLMGLLPKGLSEWYISFERYGFIVLIILIWFGAFERLLWPLVRLILRLMGA